jgi:phosphoglycerate dehydrogenase-like enzyme
MSMKTVLQYRASPGFCDQIKTAFAHLEPVTVVDEFDEPRFHEAMLRAQVLLHVLKPVTAEVIANAPHLKLIQKLGVGTNTIDLVAAKARGIAVCNMPGTNSQAVAEMALTLMLSCLRRTVYLDSLTRLGKGWSPDLEALDSVGEVCGRTVGLIGFGQSAQRLAPVLGALGAQVIYTARSPRPDAPYGFCNLEALLERADIISLHLPLTDQTRNLIDAKALGRMKPGAIVINTSRGEIIDEAALVAALRSGHLRGAGLDVFAIEPAGADNGLFALDRVVVAPHQAWLTPETLSRSLAVAKENCRRLAVGEDLLHRVV